MTRARRSRVRSLILGAALLTLSGIALCVASDEALGKWAVLLGLALLIVGLHRFGRSGKDAPLDLDPAPRARRRKKPARDPAS